MSMNMSMNMNMSINSAENFNIENFNENSLKSKD